MGFYFFIKWCALLHWSTVLLRAKQERVSYKFLHQLGQLWNRTHDLSLTIGLIRVSRHFQHVRSYRACLLFIYIGLCHWIKWLTILDEQWYVFTIYMQFESFEWYGVYITFDNCSVLLWRCFLWQILPRSAASLEYGAAINPNTETPPSHNISTPGQPVLVISSELGPLAQSVEPWKLDRRVLGSSLGRGVGLCPWARHFIHIDQTAEVGDASPIWRWGWKQSVTHIQIKMYAHEKVNKKKSFKCGALSAKFYVFGLTRDRSHDLPLTRQTL